MYTVLHNVHFQSGNLNILWHISSRIIFVSLFQLLLNDLSPVDWKKNYAGRSILWKTGALYVIIKYWFGEDYVIFVVKYCGGWKGRQSRLNVRLNPLWEICFVRLASSCLKVLQNLRWLSSPSLSAAWILEQTSVTVLNPSENSQLSNTRESWRQQSLDTDWGWHYELKWPPNQTEAARLKVHNRNQSYKLRLIFSGWVKLWAQKVVINILYL